MNKNIAILVLFGVVAALALGTEQEQRTQFQSFKQRFGKSYISSLEEERRFRIFQANLASAEEKNRRFPKTYFGVTKFMDLTPQEFKDLYLMNESILPPLVNHKVERRHRIVGGLPANYDWNNKTGVVSPVKDQGQCGSCWDFSATETLESVWALAGHTLVTLSEQQTVDCDTTDYGCDGGWPYQAYAYMMSAGGVESEADYPYTATDGTCQFNSADVVAKVNNWKYVIPTNADTPDEAAMQDYVYKTSPVSVCVDAEAWQTYSGGIMTADACGNSIDHCVQVTGWSTVGGTKVWNVRNSWNTDWGNDGYIWVEYGTNACAIGEVVTVPIV